jgi:uncharacterized protein (DUF1778 family)
MDTASRRRSRRMDLRTTPEERELIDRAVAATGTDLTDFVVTHACDAARRVLADRDRFDLDPKAPGVGRAQCSPSPGPAWTATLDGSSVAL